MAESTSQLQAKLKALTHGKVDIMLNANTFKSTTQILREMSEAWEEMTDIERAKMMPICTEMCIKNTSKPSNP